MSRSRFGAIASMTAVAALALTACGDSAIAEDNGDSGNGEAGADGEWPTELELVSIPSEESTSLVDQYGLIAEVLEDELDVTINLETATDYAAVIEAMRAGHADIANFGPFSFVTAADTGAGAVPVAVAVDEPEDPPVYTSYAITASDRDDIEGLEDFEGQSICFVDQVSTSGFLYPTAGLMEAGVEDYESTFAGGHDASAISVANGDCDAGFAFDDMVDEEIIASGDVEEGDLKVVWESEDIPSAPFAANENTLPADMIDEMERVFVEKINVEWMVDNGYCDSEDDCDIPNGNWHIEADDAVFDGIRAVCDITEAEACSEGE